VSPAAAAAAALRERGLDAVLDAARTAGPDCAARLLREAGSLDWEQLDRQRAALATSAATPVPVGGLEPPELLPPSSRLESLGIPEATARGWEELRQGRVAVVTLAGGQASRLGFDGPKGAYPLGTVSGASLFQILAGMIARLRARSGTVVPWILMTGLENDAATRTFFERRNHFGLGSSNVHFACQGMLPALTPEGELLLAAPDRLFRNPDGHGGLFRALARSGLLELLKRRGVRNLFTCQVDNPLVRMADPAFLGLHALRGARMSCKAVVKTDPAEKVGVLALRDGKLECIEYSDLPVELQNQRAADGGLRLRAGNLAMHALDLEFAAEMAAQALPLHRARKEVTALGADLVPQRRIAVKFETFLFDALPCAGPGKTLVQEALREEEFAPLKNRTGADSADAVRHALDARARRWLHAAGCEVAACGQVEIEPGLALDALDLAAQGGTWEIRTGRFVVRSGRR
jgi:UDP-N-acetylglucosamine/UDP-N-acetylgalactosamine diphosphorylase